MSTQRLDYLSMHTVEANGCWTYTGTINNKGYGSILQTTAQRHIYALAIGPIPAGLEIDHTCTHIQCVNPDHLEAVTPAENMRRRSVNKTHCLRGHEFTEANTRFTHRKNGTARSCIECNRAMQRRLYSERTAA